MANIFTNAKISHKLAALTGITLLVIAGLGWDEILNSRTIAKDSLRTEEATQAFGLLDGIAHNFAVERGLTAGFLGSGGDAGIKEKLDAQSLKPIKRNRHSLISLLNLSTKNFGSKLPMG
ncbi:hypothetical protein [Enterovibrio coralii]|uniref:Nitrate/nitrite sensing protein domain-containing protein n=1 Tax=Enterovibrio coralii TaxID=294935 RepID=A0A135IBE9_9GAMM|nr:hypothetical protein [Enterovibrio coralii]KXF82674.1 hypothetical protein ATN88_14375 [Enterovibrio coralii]